jgi:xylan 1,4-beta-xylosidase
MKLLNVVFACTLLVHSGIVHAQQLVLRGDYPDPSVIKVGETYWASATTSNWAPVYPLVKSNDLKNWETVGHVFRELPDWADYYFWAPELNYDSGKVYVYYSAHKKVLIEIMVR